MAAVAAVASSLPSELRQVEAKSQIIAAYDSAPMIAPIRP